MGPQEEQRRVRRRPLRANGAVAVDGTLLFDCSIVDFTEAGAQLNVGDNAVPDRFQLIDIAGGVAYSARTVWRKRSAVGISFLQARTVDAPDTPEWIVELWRDLRRRLGRATAA